MVNTTVTGDDDYDLIIRYFREFPNEDAAIAAMSLYIVVTLISLVLTVKTRCWFMLMVPITGGFEFGGFACRISMLHNPARITFIIQQCFLIISPVLLAIVDYICVGRIIKIGRATADATRALREQQGGGSLRTDGMELPAKGHVKAVAEGHQSQQVMSRANAGNDGCTTGCEEVSLDEARRSSGMGRWLGRMCSATCCTEGRAAWVARAFTASDIFCLVLQGSGGAMLAGDDVETQQRGTNLLLAGLSLQLAFFSLFTFLVIYAHYSPDIELKGPLAAPSLFFCLYATIVLMFIRNIFRVVEFAMGWDGELQKNEVYLYIFDFIPIFLCFCFFCAFHFGFYLGKDASKHQSCCGNRCCVSPDVEAGSGEKAHMRASAANTREAELVAHSGDVQGQEQAHQASNGVAEQTEYTQVRNMSPLPLESSGARL